MTRDYADIQLLKDQNFELKVGQREVQGNLDQLNGFLKETKDELDFKNMTIFKKEKEFKDLRGELLKIQDFSKSKEFSSIFR